MRGIINEIPRFHERLGTRCGVGQFIAIEKFHGVNFTFVKLSSLSGEVSTIDFLISSYGLFKPLPGDDLVAQHLHKYRCIG